MLTGALALLLDAFPHLSEEHQRSALLAGAVDLGVSGPDMNFGYGRLDVRSAFDWLVNHEDELSLILTTPSMPITVTTTSDIIGVDGLCSLREAVVAANSDAPFNGCAAGSGVDLITFAPTLPQPVTIALTTIGATEDFALTGDLDLLSPLTIDGGAAGSVVIDGNDTDRVFDIRAGAQVTMTGLLVRNGRAEASDAGGGIRVTGTLTLYDLVVSSNWGGGIADLGGRLTLSNTQVISNVMGYGVSNQMQGTLTMTGGVVNYNEDGGVFSALSTAALNHVDVVGNLGSGVHNEGASIAHFTLSASTIMSNSAVSGAGVFNQGVGATMTIARSRITDNTASSSGGGVFNNGILSVVAATIDHNTARAGGGIHHFGGTLNLTNDTFSANTAIDNGGGLYVGGAATIRNVTFYQNQANGEGGNLFNDEGSIAIGSTIVAGAVMGDNCVNSAGSINSLGYNLESAATCGFDATQDLNNADPQLGPLQVNGGLTPSHAPTADSPALDRIPLDVNQCGQIIDVDQRSVARPQGATCDTGAVEREVVQQEIYMPFVFRATP